MSVTPAPRVLSNPARWPWPTAVIVVVVVLIVPTAMLHQVFADVITLSALLVGASMPAAKYSNRRSQ